VWSIWGFHAAPLSIIARGPPDDVGRAIYVVLARRLPCTLRTLQLSRCHGNRDVSALARSVSLRELNLSYSAVCDAGMGFDSPSRTLTCVPRERVYSVQCTVQVRCCAGAPWHGAAVADDADTLEPLVGVPPATEALRELRRAWVRLASGSSDDAAGALTPLSVSATVRVEGWRGMLQRIRAAIDAEVAPWLAPSSFAMRCDADVGCVCEPHVAWATEGRGAAEPSMCS
jgi:hypothetical protein